jgi:hypothetical protein
MKLSEIETATFRVVAQCLDQNAPPRDAGTSVMRPFFSDIL